MSNTDIITATISCIDGILEAAESSDNIEIRDEVLELAKVYQYESDGEVGNLLELEHKVMLACWNHLKELLENTPAGDSVREVMAKEFFSIPMAWIEKK